MAQVNLLPHQSPDKDEDPSLLSMPDGSVWVFWFSNRPHGERLLRDIVYCAYRDGAFGDLRVVTDGGDKDVYPNAVLDPNGLIHVCWMRRKAEYELIDAPAWIAYRTIDVASGALGQEQDVTQLASDRFSADWVPSIALDRTGAPVIVYARQFQASPGGVWDLMWTRLVGGRWSAPEELPINSPEHHDNLPFISNVGGDLFVSWVRNPRAGKPYAWERSDSEIWLTRYDGARWRDGRCVAPNPTGKAPNIFPSHFRDHSGRWWLSWQRVVEGQHSVVAVPLDRPDAEPATLPVPIAGYDPRIAAAAGGKYLAVWVWKGPGPREYDIAFHSFNWVR